MEIKGAEIICPYCKMVEDSSLESSLHLHPGTRIQGNYLIGRALGQGGFGITYLAWDLNLNLKLAIFEDGTYTGEVKGGRPHGRGMRTFVDGEVLFGKWANDEYVGP